MKTTPRTRTLGLHVSLFAAATLMAACSAAPPPETTPTASPTGGSLAAATGAPVDLSPVPAPAGLVAKGRLANLTVATHLASGIIGAPQDKVDGLAQRGLAELIVGRKGMRLDVDAERLASELVIDAPMDFVVVLGDADRPDPQVAFSIGIRSLDGVREAAGDSITDAGPQGFTLTGKRAKGSCVASVAAGPVKARLVCAPRDEDLLALRPYMTRTLPVEPSPPSDLYAEVDIAAIDAKFGGQLRKIAPSLPSLVARQYGIGEPTFDHALEDLLRFATTEGAAALSDLDKVHVEGKVDPGGTLSLSASSTLRDKKSWFVRTALAMPAGPAPALFWRGPADAATGGFVTFGDPAAYGDVVRPLMGLLEGGLASAKVGSDAERKKLAALLDFPLQKGAVFAFFSGDGQLTKPGPAKTAKEQMQAGLAATSGWTLLATSQKADGINKWLDDVSRAVSQPGIQAAIKKQTGGDLMVTMKAGRAPAKLTGAKQYDLRVVGNGKAPKAGKPADKVEITYSIIVFADGDSTWIAGGFDANELGERLLQAKAGGATLDGRADLAALKVGNLNGGGFFSARTFRSSVMSLLLFRTKRAGAQGSEGEQLMQEAKELDQMMDGLPSKGRSPIFYESSATPTELRASIVVPKSTFEEIAAGVKLFR